MRRRTLIGMGLVALAGCTNGAGIVGPDGQRTASGIISSGRFGVNLAAGPTVTPKSEPGQEIRYTLRGDKTRVGSPIQLIFLAKDDRLSGITSVRVAGGLALGFVAPQPGGRNPLGVTIDGLGLTADVPLAVYRTALRDGLIVELVSAEGVTTVAIPASYFADFDIAWQRLLTS